MSIGIGVTLPDGALLIADGRQIRFLAENKAPVDDIDKIIKVSESVYSIPFGVTLVTHYTIQELQNAPLLISPEDLSGRVEMALNEGWQDFWSKLAPDVDLKHPGLKAAIITGGILNHEFFIAGSLCGNHSYTPPMLHKKHSQFQVLGGEKQNATELLIRTSASQARGVKWDYSTGPLNQTVKAILEAAKSVIRLVESQDESVGGLIRYAVIRKNYPVLKEILD